MLLEVAERTGCVGGRWLLFAKSALSVRAGFHVEGVDTVWAKVARAVVAGRLGPRAVAMTCVGFPLTFPTKGQPLPERY